MAAKVKGIPDNSAVVIPRLICKDVAAAIDFSTNTRVFTVRKRVCS